MLKLGDGALVHTPRAWLLSSRESGAPACPIDGSIQVAPLAFKAEPTRGKAIMACFPAWHIQDWIWHQQHPGEDTRNNSDYQLFQQQLFADCPELQWIRDVADAGKHRGLGRQSVEVREVKSAWPLNATPLTMTLGDGTQHAFADVLDYVIQFWQAEIFSMKRQVTTR
jgi:hypothetical protein